MPNGKPAVPQGSLRKHRRPEGLPLRSGCRRASARATAAHFGLTGFTEADVQSGLPCRHRGSAGRMMWWRTRILGWSPTQNRPSATTVPPTEDGHRYDFAVATPQQAAHLAKTGQLSRPSTPCCSAVADCPSWKQRSCRPGRKLQPSCGLRHDRDPDPHRDTPTRQTPVSSLPGVQWTVAPDGGLVLDVPERQVHALHTGMPWRPANRCPWEPGLPVARATR